MHIGETIINSFGRKLEIVGIRNCHDIDVLIDDLYLRKNASYSNFKNGSIRSPYQPMMCGVGYFGEGKYSSRNSDGSINQAYQKWNDMMKRCYSKNSLKTKPLYSVVTVCEEWHDFQKFAEWFEENKIEVDEEINIDKDIINGDSKIYSPSTCCIVPKTINLIFIRGRKCKEDRKKIPIGVIPTRNGYTAQLSREGKRIRSYNHVTPESAFQWYKTEKEKYIKEVAERYKDVLPERTYNALINYEVKPFPYTEEELAS